MEGKAISGQPGKEGDDRVGAEHLQMKFYKVVAFFFSYNSVVLRNLNPLVN